ESFLLVPDAGIHRQLIRGLPRILDERILILLQRLPAGVEVGARHAIDAPEGDVRQNRHARAGRGLAPVRRLERRTGALAALRVGHIVVLEAVLDLMRLQAVRRLDRVLIVQAAFALQKADAAADDVWQTLRGAGRVGDGPFVDRRRLRDGVQRARVIRLDEEPVRQDAVVAEGLVVAAVVERA